SLGESRLAHAAGEPRGRLPYYRPACRGDEPERPPRAAVALEISVLSVRRCVAPRDGRRAPARCGAGCPGCGACPAARRARRELDVLPARSSGGCNRAALVPERGGGYRRG